MISGRSMFEKFNKYKENSFYISFYSKKVFSNLNKNEIQQLINFHHVSLYFFVARRTNFRFSSFFANFLLFIYEGLIRFDFDWEICFIRHKIEFHSRSINFWVRLIWLKSYFKRFKFLGIKVPKLIFKLNFQFIIKILDQFIESLGTDF